jgi:glycosyltransferase involved in cell wall biosynthesis
VPSFIILIQCFFLKLLGKKKFTLVLTPHGSFTSDWSIFPKWQVFIKRPFHYIAVFFINRTVDGIIAVSEWEKGQMVQKGIKSDLLRVIYNGIEKKGYEDVEAKASEKTKKLVKELGQYIIQVGTIQPRKNQEVVIKTLPLLPAEVKFAIVGPFENSEYFEKLQRLIEELGLQGRVVFLGTITGHNKYYLMRHAHLMVHMSRHEALCNAVHEGMSQGCICIVSKDTALTDLIKEGINGYHADPYDHRDVAEKINFVLKNLRNANTQSIKRENIKVTRNHSWENTARQLEEYFLQLLKQG